MKLRRLSIAATIALLTTSCAVLLNLPDELSEDHYRQSAGDISAQNKKNMQSSPGALLVKENEGLIKKMAMLPVVYVYDTTNTLKKNEEAYYTSKFNGYWMRAFAVLANNYIYDEFKARGIDIILLRSQYLKEMGARDINQQIDHFNKNQTFHAVAFNAESDETNLAETDFYKFRKYINTSEEAVAYMLIQADWEPSSANRLNGDIVLNTTLKFGYEIVVCGPVSGCSSVTVPYSKGIVSNVFMPNRNTIDKDGMDKNWALIKEIHGAQLKTVISEAFKVFDKQGMFK
jgi:hypothetical protein